LIERLDWVDYLKTVGILAVILGHIASPFGKFIYSWHMPLFFMVAGFFIKINDPFIYFVKKDFKRLIIPYFIFSIVGLIAEAIKRWILNRDGLDFIYEIFGLFLWMDMESLSNTYAFVLWFLPVLFFSRLIVYFVQKIKTKYFSVFIILAFFCISFLVDLPFGLDNALNSALFVYVGFLYFKIYKYAQVWLIVLSLVWLFYFLFFHSYPYLDLATKEYESLFINVLWAVSFFVFLTLILQMIKLPDAFNKLNRFWAQNTMIVFIIHPYTNNFAYIFNKKILCDMGAWQYTFLISVFCLIFLVVIKVFLEQKNIIKIYV
jgi:fucose 4-O-acetylase-like acetyltransferase